MHRHVDKSLDEPLYVGARLPSGLSVASFFRNQARPSGGDMGQLSVGLAMKLKDVRQPAQAADRSGVSFPRYFTAKLEPGKTPYDDVKWELRTATIGNDKGAVIFEQSDVEVPADWSQTATNIVVSKYFHGKMGSPDRERSVAQLVHRVVDTITDWGKTGRYFKTETDAENFRNELAH